MSHYFGGTLTAILYSLVVTFGTVRVMTWLMIRQQNLEADLREHARAVWSTVDQPPGDAVPSPGSSPSPSQFSTTQFGRTSSFSPGRPASPDAGDALHDDSRIEDIVNNDLFFRSTKANLQLIQKRIGLALTGGEFVACSFHSMQSSHTCNPRILYMRSLT